MKNLKYLVINKNSAIDKNVFDDIDNEFSSNIKSITDYSVNDFYLNIDKLIDFLQTLKENKNNYVVINENFDNNTYNIISYSIRYATKDEEMTYLLNKKILNKQDISFKKQQLQLLKQQVLDLEKTIKKLLEI